MINSDRIPRDLIVIGPSAGGVTAVITLLERLPASMPVVLHRSPFHATRLPWILGRRTKLLVTEATDGARIEHGTVYLAPRDQHLVFEDDVLRADRGPKEHRTRPAIDPLFRTAAAFHGRRVVGVLLSAVA